MMGEEIKTKYSVEDIQQSYDDAKAKEERYGEWVAHYIYRPLSFQITPLLLQLGLTPSNVTLMSLMLALTLPFIAMWLPMPYLFIGLIAIIISVLDCVDGNIARVTGQTSLSGQYFDFLTDILHRVLLYLAIGIVLSSTLLESESFHAIATECLLLAALLAIIARMSRIYVDSELLASEKQEENSADDSRSWLDEYLFPFVSGLDWALPFMVIFFGLFGLLHWVLIWLIFYSLLDFTHTQYSIYLKFKK